MIGKRIAALGGFFAVVFLCGGGCTITIDTGGGGGNDNGGGTTPSTVTVRLFNDTSATLDPEIYITGAAVTDPNQLFADPNRFTNFGVGRRGLLGDFDSDEFTIDCSQIRVIGTKGGAFGDDLNNPDGVGQQRILTQDVTFGCGETITIRYARSGSSYTTTMSVTR